MKEFEFHGVGRIIFGRGQFARIGDLAAELGRAALIVANGTDLGEGGIADRLVELLAGADVRGVFLRQRGEPQIADVERAVAACPRAAIRLED